MTFRVKKVLFLLTVFYVGAVSADNSVNSALEKISHQIAYINTFGFWKEGKANGVYRVILMDAKGEHPHSKIFLQWVKQTDSGQEPAVIAMAPVDEINNVGAYALSVPRILQSDDGYVVELTAINQYSRVVQNIHLVPTELGRYRFRYAASQTTDQVNAAVNKIPLKLDYYVRPTF